MALQVRMQSSCLNAFRPRPSLPSSLLQQIHVPFLLLLGGSLKYKVDGKELIKTFIDTWGFVVRFITAESRVGEDST